jgi:N-acetylglucosamine malate deacetylase 1
VSTLLHETPLRSLVRTLLPKLAGRRMAKTLRALLGSASVRDHPVRRCQPEKAKIVVLAPHMDDEVLGCGGTIALHVAAGSDVSVVFLTDGRLGGPADEDPSDIVTVRKEEARRAAQVLGVNELTFLDAQDSRLRFDTAVAGRLREVLERKRPEIVYLPFFLERHPDHRAANDVLLAATRQTQLDFECRGYEVWTATLANCLVAIDATLGLKREALTCYRSQLAQMDYLHSGLGLNAWRAMGLGSGVRFAEAFHAARLAQYLQLYGSLDGTST